MRRLSDMQRLDVLLAPIAIVVTVVLLVTATPALAQQTDDTAGMQVAPARLQIDIEDRTIDHEVLFVNNESDVTQVIEIELTGLGHKLDGSLMYPDDPAVDAAVSVDEGTYQMGPGERLELDVTGSLPEGEPALYTAVTGTFRPREAGRGKAAAQVQLASIQLIRGPRPWDESVGVRDAGVRPDPDGGGVQVFAIVENRGDVHVRPSGSVRVTDEAGDELGIVDLRGEIILPGYARRLIGSWEPPAPLAGGPVDLDVQLSDPPAAGRWTADMPAVEPVAPGDTSGDASGDTGRVLLSGIALVLILLTLFLLTRVRRRGSDREGTVVVE